ncbi:MAG: carboxypeptidase-like regulatory domain-containing protein, partial [Bacteroidales bacterium]|nr:carboxypeptidase-like regulatory domain-containing protein [Bacteroidales bacterium]
MNLLLWLGSFAGVYAQSAIQGKVVDENKEEPLSGVTVALKGTTTGVITGTNGEFSLRPEELPATLLVSFVGYRSQEIVVYDTSDPLVIALGE